MNMTDGAVRRRGYPGRNEKFRPVLVFERIPAGENEAGKYHFLFLDI